MSESNKNPGQSPAHKKYQKVLIQMLPLLAVVTLIIAGFLIIPNIPAFKTFESTTYTNAKGARYQLEFYRKHTTSKLQSESGNTQLVSKVSRQDKLPITVSIASGDGASAYNELKSCGEYNKLFVVQNDNLKQKITVCDLQSSQVVSSQDTSNTVYVAAFLTKNRTNVITIAQDYSKVNLSDAAAAQAAKATFGLQPYTNDIKTIIASIKAQ
jgi:hypothetical protein